MPDSIEFSLIYPMHNEEANVDPLLQRTFDSLIMYYHSEQKFEIICINDGSTDSTQKKLDTWTTLKKNIRMFVFEQSHGHSAALAKGFELISTSKYTMICDADLQYFPEEIPKFLEEMEKNPQLCIINGWRVKKYEPYLKIITSNFYNSLMRFFFKTQLHDHASTFTLYRTEQVRNLNLQNNDQRYIIPMIKAKWKLNKDQIIEIPIQHQTRKHGKSHYSVMKNILFGLYETIKKKIQLSKA